MEVSKLGYELNAVPWPACDRNKRPRRTHSAQKIAGLTDNKQETRKEPLKTSPSYAWCWYGGLALACAISFTFVLLFGINNGDDDAPVLQVGVPVQIKLSHGKNGTMLVSWVTAVGDCRDQNGDIPCRDCWNEDISKTFYEFPHPFQCQHPQSVVVLDQIGTFYGSANLFVSHDSADAMHVTGKRDPTPRWIHLVQLSVLQRDTVYTYRVGSPGKWSQTFDFHTPKLDEINLIVVGDVPEDKVPPHPTQMVQSGAANLYLHVGDIAYDLESDHGWRGDSYLSQMQSVSAHVPFHAWAGNHETGPTCDYLAYRARFFNQNFTSDSNSSRYYSFDIPGILHVVGIDTNVWRNIQCGRTEFSFHQAQLDWLKKDLARVNKTETPWVIMLGHHPMYCSSSGYHAQSMPSAHCESNLNTQFRQDLEPYMVQIVDVYIAGHVHAYERTWPTSQGQVQKSYYKPSFPSHIMTGTSGYKTEFMQASTVQNFTVMYNNIPSYTYLKIVGDTLTMEQRHNTHGNVLDTFTLNK